MATLAKIENVWFCLDCNAQLTEGKTRLHKCNAPERTINDIKRELEEEAVNSHL